MLRRIVDKRDLNLDNVLYTIIVYKTFCIFSWSWKYYWELEQVGHVICSNKVFFDSYPEARQNLVRMSNILDPLIVTYTL